MPKDNLFDFFEYRRRRAFRLNRPSEEVDNPEVRLEARMEMIEDHIRGLVTDPMRCGRISVNGIEMWGEMITVRCHSRDQLITLLNNSNDADWKAQPNRFLAVIAKVRKLTPPTTKS